MINELKKFGLVKHNISLKKYNTFKIGGAAEYLVFPDNIEKLRGLIDYLQNNKQSFIVLGNGSNIVLSEKTLPLVIKLDYLNNFKIKGQTVYAEAGLMLPVLSMTTVKKNLKGLEWAVGIPGTVGGSIYGNAGAYKCCIFDYLKTITYLDDNNELITINKDDIEYRYRFTDFKNHPDRIIVSAELNLAEGNYKESMDIIRDRTKRRHASQPLNYKSAGSVFRNPENDFAGRLIEECGLKGKSIGDAVVSPKHANFIVNVGNATSQNIYDLIQLVHDEVYKKFNVDLIVEQQFIGWD